MRKTVMSVAFLVVFLAASVANAQMQHPAPPKGQAAQPPAGQSGPPPHQMPEHAGGMMMMCPMMMGPGMMGSGAMGMMGGQDPKMMGRMLKMRGEMMKAMGDIMMKHGAEMEQGK